MGTPNSGLSIVQRTQPDGSPQPTLAQQMLEDGSLPDVAPASPPPVPMRAVVAAASTQNPDAEAKTQQLAQQAGMGVDLTRANPQAAQQRALALDMERRQIEFTNPILARQLSDPNFAAVAHDDLDSLSRIEQGAAGMRVGELTAPTPRERFFWNYEQPVDQFLTKFWPTRVATDAVAGTAEMAGNVGSFFGLHGNGPTRQNWLQRFAQSGSPEAVGLESNQGDAVVRNVAPLIPAALASGGTSLLADTLGLSTNAAKTLAAISVGGMFSADQGGRTFTQQAAAGKSDAEARRDADLVAGITLPANLAMGFADRVPFLERSPLLAALGIGGATGASGQMAQNIVTGQPLRADLAKGAIEGAAVQAGMHLGFDFLGQMGDTIDAVEASKLRARSPEAFQKYVDAQFDGDASVRIPAQEFVDYFANKKIDPAAMANHLGATNLEEAAAAGSELEIPKANFFGKLEPEHQKGLLPDVVDPATDLTARQAEAGRAELNDFVSSGRAAQLAAEFQQADAETQATPEWQKVQSDLKQRYMDAGETEPAAERYATLQANALSYFAKNTGLKPDELLALHNPKIVTGEAPGTAEAAAPVRYQDAIENIRSVVQAAKQEGHAPQKATIAPADPWLVDRAKENGLDIDGYQHVVDGSAIRHVINRHGNEATESQQGQIAITDKDFEKIPEVLAEPDRVVFGTKSKGGRDQIGYAKRMLDGSTLYIEEARRGRKELAAVSMRKFPATMDADRVAANLHLDAQDDGIAPIVIRHPSADKNETLYQGEPEPGAAPQGVRGWFRMRPDGSVEIGKTKIGDVSTLVHEPGHGYLELFRTMTQREGASDRIKNDFANITEWLGTTPEEVYKNGYTREQQEQWARASEQYVREGKAPTSALSRVFHQFGVFLQSIYRRASALGVEMSPEVRGVMDRLYAGENAVDRAERESNERWLFGKPEDAGWTEAEYRKYAETHDLAVDEARAQVQRELNEAAEREHTEDRQEETRNVRDAVTEQVDARPEYKAIRSLRKGALDDGTPLTLNRDALVDQFGEERVKALQQLTLNRDALVDQFGEERVKALQQLHRGIYRNEGGTDAETAAELFGFGSGEEMMRALEAAPRRSAAIEQATRDYLVNKYGDVRYDGTLNDRARFALENDERAGNIYREVKALRAKVAVLEKKAADTKAAMASITMEPLDHYREAARQMIDQKAPADLQPHRYLDAGRKFSREAFDAAGKGNVRRAAEAKNKELLNHFLFREASAARDWAEGFEKRTQKAQSKGAQQRLGLADQNARQTGGAGDYRDQHNWLLARYKLDRMGPEQIQRPERSLRGWAEEMYNGMKEPAIASGILDSDRDHFQDWRGAPMRELRDVDDALTNIRHLARQEYEALVDGKHMQIEQMAKELDEGIRANMKVKPEKVFEKKTGFLRGLARSVDVQNSRMEFLIHMWDGGLRGSWRRYAWEPYENAKGDEFGMQADFTKAVNDAVEKEAERQGLRLTQKVAVDGIPASEDELTRKHLVSMALNMGNASNYDRLEKTFDFHKWDRDAIQRVAAMLKPEEWRFVQGVWDALKPWGERMKEMEKRLTGLPPLMVEVKPFKVALDDGTEMDLAGGYYLVKYDPRYVSQSYEEDAAKSARNLMEKGYGRATTSRNYTKERTASAGPLLLDYERVLTDHIAKVTKDLSHREFMLTLNRLLLHPRVQKALRETQGPGADQDAMAWLRATVNDRNGSIDGGPNDMRPYLMKLRSNLVKASLAFKGSTSLLQFTHLPRLMEFTNPKSYTQSMVDFWKNPIEMTRTIRELSPNEMRFRGENLSRDYRATLQEVAEKKGISAAGLRFGYAAFRYVDHAVSFPLWHAVYNDTLVKNGPEMDEGESHKIAMHAADSAVRMGMGTGTTGDLPPIMRSPDLFKQFETTLFGFENLNYNLIRHKVGGDAARNVRAGAYGSAATGLTYGLAMTFFIPAIVSSLVRGDGPKDGENWGLWAAKRALFFGMGTIPLVKDIAAMAEFGSDRSLNPMAGMAGKIVDDFRRSGREGNTDWAGFGIDALEGLGDAAGVYGTAEAAHIARYAHRANQGKVENPNVWGAIVGGR